MEILHRLSPGEAAPDMPVFDPSGALVSLASLWRDRPSVPCYLRNLT